MLSVFFLLFSLSNPYNLPRDLPVDLFRKDTAKISKNALQTNLNTKRPITLPFSDTLLSPIESMFIKITHKRYLRQIGYRALINRGNGGNAELQPAPDYKLDSGDEIVIYLTGTIENSFRVIVDRSGMIFIPGLGTVNAAGLTLDGLEKKLNMLARKKWTNVKVITSPGRIRGIKVYLTGEVLNPGVYALKAHTTLLDLLFTAGGVLKTGSLRDIQITHRDGTVSSVDLYPYIFGGKARLPQLKNGDIVTVPTLKNVIAVDGCVHRYGIYETKNYTTLKNLLNWAGVLPFSQHRAEIHRIEGDSIVIFSIPLKRWQKTRLKPGDYIYVPFSKLNTGGYVFIKGNVKREGYYTYTPDMTLSELITLTGGFLYPPFKDILVYRKDSFTRKIIEVDIKDTFRFKLSDADSVIIFRADIIKRKTPVTINGYVENPGVMLWSKGLSVKKAILSAIPRNDADLNNITVYSKASGKVLIFSKDTWDSYELDPGDVIYVPQDTLKHNKVKVFVRGEVKYPGVYTLKKGSTVRDALHTAGGTLKDGYREGIYIKRSIISRKRRASITNTILYSMLGVAEDSMNLLSNDMKKIIESRIENTIPADTSLILMDGDTIVIPSFTPYIYIAGAVLKPYVAPFKPGATIQEVIKKAPLHPNADRKNVFAISINGKIHRGKVKAGDILFVPFKERRGKTALKDLAIISTILYQIAMAIFVIYQVNR